MASPPLPSLLVLLALICWPLVLGQLHLRAAAPKQKLTGILLKGAQFSTFLRLLNMTQVGKQIDGQLSNSYDGITVFAPTDDAFDKLPAGTLNGLSTEEQVELVLFHVLPRFYSFDMFQAASNPVRTQASGGGGVDTLNVTGTDTQANVSTGIDATRINAALYAAFPLAVYPVDSVLLPYALFGPKPPTSAPPLESGAGKGSGAPLTATARAPAAASARATSSPSAASLDGRRVGWAAVTVAAGLACLCLLC